jgi:hypothetical protein
MQSSRRSQPHQQRKEFGRSRCGTTAHKERKFAILFAATLLCARKLAELDSDKLSPAKIYAVNTAIEKAAFIMDRIDEKWPDTKSSK